MLNEDINATDAQILDSLAKGANPTTGTSKLNEPQIEVIEGIVTKCEEVTPKEGNPFHLVTIGRDAQIVVNRTAMLRDRQLFTVGTTVVATCERRVEGKTQYLGEDGKPKFHKSSGLSLNKVTLSETKATALGAFRDKLTEQRELNGLAVDKADQLAQVMKRYVGDDPMALATALAGLANVK